MPSADDGASRRRQSDSPSVCTAPAATRRHKAPSEEERAILDALGATNMAYGVSASVEQILAACDVAVRQRLAALPGRDVSTVVSKRLTRLVRAGLVVGAGAVGGRRYYRLAAFTEAQAPLPDVVSRRRQTLQLLEDAARHAGGAVRVHDCWQLAERHEKPLGMSRTEIARDLLNLVRTGEVAVVRRLRGGAAQGSNLYLPSRLASLNAGPTAGAPTSWQEYVAARITALWQARAAEAEAVGRRPRPITTDEVRQALRDDTAGGAHGGRPVAEAVWNRAIAEPMVTVHVLLQLASGRRPAIRRVDGRRALWVPASVPDAAVDLGDAFATDTDRVAEAVRRAVVRHGVPAVSSYQVVAETEQDPALRPAGRLSVTRVLSDISRTTLSAGALGRGTVSPRRVARVTRAVVRVGTVAGTAYYALDATNRADAAGREDVAQYIAAREALGRWARLCVRDRAQGLQHATAPHIAVGRARLLARELIQVTDELRKHQAALRELPQRGLPLDIERALEEAHAAAENVTGWLRFRAPRTQALPAGVEQVECGLVAADVVAMLTPLSPTVRALTASRAVIPLLARFVRRIPNPAFVSRRARDPHQAAEYLFDRADVLRLAGRRWGGLRLRIAVRTFEREVGDLRDERFVQCALRSSSPDERITAAFVLAFFPTSSARAALRVAASADTHVGVRETAMWAYAFAGGEDAEELLQELAQSDPSPIIRRAARELLPHMRTGFWHA